MPVMIEPSDRSELEKALQERGIGVQAPSETLRKITQETLNEVLDLIGFYFTWSSQRPEDSKFDEYMMELEEAIRQVLKIERHVLI